MKRLFTIMVTILASIAAAPSIAACNVAADQDFLYSHIETQDHRMLEFYYHSLCKPKSVSLEEYKLPADASPSSEALYYFALGNLRKYEGIKNITIPDMEQLGVDNNVDWIIAEAKLNQALRLIDSDLLLQAEYLLNEVVPIAREIGYRRLLARAYRWLGNVKIQRSNIKASLNYYKTAYELVSEIGDDFQSTMTLNNIATVYMLSEDWERADTYIQRALKLYNDNQYDNSLFEAILFANSSAIYFATDQNEQAKYYMERALEEADRTGSNRIKISTLSNMSQMFSKVGQPKEALEMAGRCVVQAEENSTSLMLASCYEAYAGAYLLKKEYQQAITYAHKVMYILQASESNEIIWEMDVLSKLVQAHEALGDYEKALRFMKQKYLVRKNFYRQTYNEDILTEKSALERRLNKREIELLEAKNELQTITLKEQRSREILYAALFGVLAFFVIRSVVNLKRTNLELRNQNTTDPLTGAYNRRFLENWLEQAPSTMQSPVYVVSVIDIDHFKLFNDQYGHEIGDLVLKETVETLQSNLRKKDILVRWGGEEFVLVMPMEDLSKLEETLERLRANVEEHIAYQNDQQFSITVSIGASSCKREYLADEWETVFGQADAALYQAKDAGRNRYQIHSNQA
ncbi:diguanylate cyclase [Vibrio europaeus]|uniref:tetratricopeptide repeat-containing diguanylate cyclase n=1 Tax=Vibrio europaeus TaxID=300876 RepID=UPI00233EF0CF|nr:diguanylate cyclase [Vibrio europaeus]MDC5719867.1 diguanylate cyclase [Vibrio europaeus]